MPLQYVSDEKIVFANTSLVDLQGFKRLFESSGQSIVSPCFKGNSWIERLPFWLSLIQSSFIGVNAIYEPLYCHFNLLEN